MHIRSNDKKPVIIFMQKSIECLPVRQRDLKNYNPDMVITTVLYRAPVIGTRGELILDEEFTTIRREFNTPTAGIAFYKQRLVSYELRLDARYAKIINQNLEYFNNIFQREKTG